MASSMMIATGTPSPRSFSAKEPFIALPGGFPIEKPLNIARRMQTERRVNLKINYAEVQLLLDKSQKKIKNNPTSEQNCPPENSEE